MDPSPGQRRAVFALIVFVLAGLGSYLFLPGALGSGNAEQARRAAAERSTHSSAMRSPGPAGPGSGTSGASPGAGGTSPGPGATSRPGRPAGPDIYQWLPFTQADLSSAATTALAFGRDYSTFSYSESAAAYVGAMRALVTPQLAKLLAGAYATPGVAALRMSRKQVSTGTVVISGLRAFGPSSLTFVVTVAQAITDTRGTTRSATQYAITVSRGAVWQVSDIELASAGNQ